MRAIEKKRQPLLNRKKWTILIILLLTLIVLLFTFFYRSIQLERWTEKAQIREVFSTQYDLSTEQYLEKYIWEDQYWILLANNLDGISQYAVMKDNEIITTLDEANVYASDRIIQSLKNSDSNAVVSRVFPGYVGDQFIWEVQYHDADTGYVKYAFYSMTNGAFLNQYTISKGT